MRREGKRFNVASNQTIKKCPRCTNWQCHSHTSETNIKERYNSDKEYRMDINKDLHSHLARSIHGHLIEREENTDLQDVLCVNVKIFEARRFACGYIDRRVGYLRKDHKKKGYEERF